MPKVLKIQDNIVTLTGEYKYKQDQYFKLSENTKGFVLSASETDAKLLVIGDPSEIKVNTTVTLTDDTSKVNVYKHYFGKIISPFGKVIHPISSKVITKTIIGVGDLETKTPSILERVPLDKPLDTGTFAIDTLIPLGLGQRELIIGDRNTGKTTLAINTIINQKDNNVKTIYVAIGQKRSSIVATYNTLKENDALKDAIIIFSNPDSASEQLLAPKIGIAMAEALAHKGQDVLIVFDDLSKHASVYRGVSLSIGRSPGREAYPTDIFFKHSSLLEKAGKFNKKKYNGGSITALPIVETVQGDIASLIPSNVISITDGQIFTSAQMFNKGELPAINISLSVSRTGSSVQSKMIRKASKNLMSDYSMLSEIKKFSDMSIDISDELEKKLEKWSGLNNALLQYGNKPYSRSLIVIMIELYRAGALGRIIEPKKFSLVLRHFIETDKVAERIAKEIEGGNISDNKLKNAMNGLFIPLAKTASGVYGNLFSKKEIEDLKGGK